MLGITMGAVIGTEVGKAPEPCVIGDIADIQARVGGHFDCVRVDIGSNTENEFTLVGYVNDEGAITEPPMELNIVASMIFSRELRGACVILSGTNPETKDYDGENYDLPSKFYDFLCDTIIKDVEKSVTFTRLLSSAVRIACQAKVISKEDFKYINDTIQSLSDVAVGSDFEAMPERLRELLEKSMNYMASCTAELFKPEDEED